MSSVITGSNGFLGSALASRLVAHGETDPICLVRGSSNTAKLETVSRETPTARLRIRRGSLATVEDARLAIDGADTIFHLAAMLNGTPADMYLNTVVTSRNLLEAAANMARPPKILLVSSFGVYGVAFLPPLTVINEDTPLEPAPLLRDLYSQVKLRQEQLFWEYHTQRALELTVLRAGAIYGPQSIGISARVGLQMPGVFLFLGGDNALPLSYVDNCADALIVASRTSTATGRTFNVHDDDLPTCRDFLQLYRSRVRPLRFITVPYFALLGASHAIKHYHAVSRGQLPAVFTPYKTLSSWKPMRFDNTRLHGIGWKPKVSIADGLEETFLHHRNFWEAQR
jgi:nucleoside-diphosphate-sugar epimerase